MEKEKIEKTIADCPERDWVYIIISFDQEYICEVYLDDKSHEILIEWIYYESFPHIPALEFQEHLNEAIEFMQGIRKQAIETPVNNSDEE